MTFLPKILSLAVILCGCGTSANDSPSQSASVASSTNGNCAVAATATSASTGPQNALVDGKVQGQDTCVRPTAGALRQNSGAE